MGSIFWKKIHNLAENYVVNKSFHCYTKIYQAQLQFTFIIQLPCTSLAP